MASAKQFKKVGEIIRGDKIRLFVVPSAPGKRHYKDEKITNLLYQYYDGAADGKSYKKILEKIKERYMEIIDGLDINLNHEFVTIEENFLKKAGRDYAASRGGSDITGSIVAKSIHADMYENWMDVSGFLVADPRIIKNPEVIETITYRELRELAYMGASVLHKDAIFPVRKEGILINIRNTNKPEDKGTLIVESTCEASLYHYGNCRKEGLLLHQH